MLRKVIIEIIKYCVRGIILFSAIVENSGKISQKDNSQNNIKSNIRGKHSELFTLALHRPNINYQSQDAGSDIKMQESHNQFSFDVLKSITARIKNTAVIAMAPANVSQGILPEAAGKKAPTTNEANIIFAPSRKKLETIFNSAGDNIQNNYNTETHFVKEVFLVRGSGLYI